MKKIYFYCIAVFIALPWLAGCSFSVSAGTKAETGTRIAHGRSEREDKRKTPKKAHASGKVATSAKPAHGRTSTSQPSDVLTAPAQQARPVAQPETTEKQAPTPAEASASPTPDLSASASGGTRVKPAKADNNGEKSSTSRVGSGVAESARDARLAASVGAAAKENRGSADNQSSRSTSGAIADTESAQQVKPAPAARGGVSLRAPKTAQESASSKAQSSRGSLLLKAPSEKALACSLAIKEAPRGGKIDLEGRGFGSTPVVRIAGKVARVLQQGEAKISAQIPENSDGGAVTVTALGATADCGRLEIIGKDR